MKRRLLVFLKLGSPVLLVTGFACSWIKWGDPDGFHGTGFPVPLVAWDRADRYETYRSGSQPEFIDFPYPYALVLNPLILLFAGVLLYLFIEILIKFLPGSRKA